MSEVLQIILYTTAAGACITIGALLAKFERIRPAWLEEELRHGVIAFGGGVLIGAVSLVLVPEGSEYLHHSPITVLIVLLGGVLFFLLERFMAKISSGKPQLLATLLDYIPESLALGGAFALGAESAPLLALFIGLQNLPEGFNTYRELSADGRASSASILIKMSLLIPLGPAFALTGWLYLSNYTELLGAIMLLASGGILYLIFQDIAPQSKLQKHWGPSLGAVLGFCLGLLGETLLLAN